MNISWICDECEGINSYELKYCKSCGTKKKNTSKIIYNSFGVDLHTKPTEKKTTKETKVEEYKEKRKELRKITTKPVTYIPDNDKEEKRLGELLEEKKKLDGFSKGKNIEKDSKSIFYIAIYIIYAIIDYIIIYKVEFYDIFPPNTLISIGMILGGAFGGILVVDDLMEKLTDRWGNIYPFNEIAAFSVGIFGALFYELILWGILTIIKGILKLIF